MANEEHIALLKQGGRRLERVAREEPQYRAGPQRSGPNRGTYATSTGRANRGGPE
jgi:hypothetical protein